MPKALIAKISEPTTFDLYYSSNATGQFVQYKNYAERVREMLRQYVRASGGKIHLRSRNGNDFNGRYPGRKCPGADAGRDRHRR